VLQGAFMAPVKFIREWAWENYWLVFSLTSYLVIPWLIAVFTVPRLFEIYGGAAPAALITVAIFGVGWGIGALAFGLGVERLGMSLGFAIIIGTATIVGTLIPLLTATPSQWPGSEFAPPRASGRRAGHQDRGNMVGVS
jgi:L-rhamnose-H+ transport protein